LYRCINRSRKLFLYFIILSFWPLLPARASDYIWPTDASTIMTSSFCEFRPRHYHAAIDIKTWNRTGYRIFAIEDGYVMRVRVSAFGYGKAVYLKLKDGNIVVYAHLQRFMPELEAYVNKIRQNRKHYNVDLFLKSNQFPVKKAQVLGYTGKTGIGVPHLHFEIRNSQNKPINPLQFYADKITDTIEPELYELALIPEEYTSLINFTQDTFFVNLQRRSNIILPDTLQISGKVGLALKSWDRANGATNLFSFYRANMWIDDSLVYSVEYDLFSYSSTELIELDKNFSLWRKQDGIFQNFYRHRYNRLPHYLNTPDGGGYLDSEKLRDGIHHLKIKLYDFWNNSADLEFFFRSGKPALLSYDLNKIVDNNLFLRIQSPEKLANITIYKRNDHDNWSPIPLSADPALLEYKDNYYYSYSIPMDSSSLDKYFMIRGTNSAGIPTFPLYFFPQDSFPGEVNNSGFSVRQRKFKKNWVSLKAQLYQNSPAIFLNGLKEQINNLFWFPLKPNEYQLNIPVQDINSNPDLWKSVAGPSIDDLQFFTDSKTVKVYSQDSLFSANFQPNSLYNESIVYISQTDTSNELYSVALPFKKIGKIYDLQPFDEPVREGVWVSLATPEFQQKLRGLGLYYLDLKKGWLFIPTQVDSAKLTYHARVTSLEKFTLIQDTIPPFIYSHQRTANNHITSQTNKLSFTLKDEMSGIRRESQIEVRVNGKWHLFEYDPEEDIILLTLSNEEMRQANLQIRAVDNVGNISRVEFTVN
jgi:hypothetical protein